MPRRRISKKWVYTVVVLILLIVAGVVVYLVWDSYFRDKSDINNNTGGESAQVAGDSELVNNDSVDNTNMTDDTEEVPEKKAVQYEGESPNKLDNLTGVVSYASVSGDKLMIRTSIYQYLESGSCELVITQSGATVYNEVAEIMNDATTSTCKGFDIPVTSLPSGNLQFVIYLSSKERTGEISGETSI